MIKSLYDVKSISDLVALTKTYNSEVNPEFIELTQGNLPAEYLVAEGTEEDYENIISFLMNSVIKDSRKYDAVEIDGVYKIFKDLLIKYNTSGLEDKDTILLWSTIQTINTTITNYINDNKLPFIFGLGNGIVDDSFIDLFAKELMNTLNIYLYIETDSSGVITTNHRLKFYEKRPTTPKLNDAYFDVNNNTYLYYNSGWQELAPLKRIADKVADTKYIYNPYLELTLNADGKHFQTMMVALLAKDVNNDISLIIDDIVHEPVLNNIGTDTHVRETDNVAIFKKDNVEIFRTTISRTIEQGTMIGNTFIPTSGATSVNTFIPGTITTLTTLETVLYTYVGTLIASIPETIEYFKPQGTYILQQTIIDKMGYIEVINRDRNLIKYSRTPSGLDTAAKRTPSNLELSNNEANNQLIFLDLQSVRTDQTNSRYNLVVLYKEFNSAYRTDLYIDIQELVIADMVYNDPNALFLNSISDGQLINPTVYNAYRTYTFKDTYIYNNNIHRYLYNNILKAREANESDIISYFIDKTVGGYGYQEHHTYEILAFLDIYKTTRDYYYKVLLNKSFVNYQMYSLYEKIFISFTAINRWITNKIETLKDPDFFNSEDIYNFLESYGLGVLNQFNWFIEARNYKRNIIKNFSSLMRSKGGKDVIDVLLGVFETANTTVEIKKFILLKDNEVEYDGTDWIVSTDASVKFVEVPYTSDNETRDLYKNIQFQEDYETFIEEDQMWTKENVPEELLLSDDINLQPTETKYISLVITDNIYATHINSKYALSAIDLIWDRSIKDGGVSILKKVLVPYPDVGTGIDIYQYFNNLKLLYALILKLYEARYNITPSTEPGTPKYYNINKAAAANDTAVKSIYNKVFGGFGTLSAEETLFAKTRRYDAASGGTQTLVNINSIFKYESPEARWRPDTASGSKYYVKRNRNRSNPWEDDSKLNQYGLRIKDMFTFYNHGKNSRDYVVDVLDNINIIMANDPDFWNLYLSKFYDDNYNQISLTSSTLNSQINNREYDTSNMFEKIINKLIRFPMDIFSGLLTSEYRTDLEKNKAFRTIIEETFEKLYISTTDILDATGLDASDFPDSATFLEDAIGYMTEVIDLPSTVIELDDAITKYSDKLLLLLTSLHNVFSTEPYMQFYFSLKGNEQNTLDFVIAAVNIFLSYTTKLYRTGFNKELKSRAEGVPFAEDLTNFNINLNRFESAFYDEELTIEEV